MTYSIVARDSATGALGVAVQSHFFSVGSVVPWAQPNAGAVATQAMADITYGPKGLTRLAAGEGASDALAALVAADDASATRQVAIVDARGGAAVHTGARCIADAGHVVGDGWTVEANMMRRPGVPEAMAEAYTAALADESLDLAGRLLLTLDAAEAAGGDVRGRQSAAVLVVPAEGEPWTRTVELRVEDGPDPLGELRRLLALRRAYSAGVDAPVLADNPELRFWHALGLAAAGDVDKARPIVAGAVSGDPGWADLLRRLPAAGLFPDDQNLIGELLS